MFIASHVPHQIFLLMVPHYHSTISPMSWQTRNCGYSIAPVSTTSFAYCPLNSLSANGIFWYLLEICMTQTMSHIIFWSRIVYFIDIFESWCFAFFIFKLCSYDWQGNAELKRTSQSVVFFSGSKISQHSDRETKRHFQTFWSILLYLKGKFSFTTSVITVRFYQQYWTTKVKFLFSF